MCPAIVGLRSRAIPPRWRDVEVVARTPDIVVFGHGYTSRVRVGPIPRRGQVICPAFAEHPEATRLRRGAAISTGQTASSAAARSVCCVWVSGGMRQTLVAETLTAGLRIFRITPSATRNSTAGQEQYTGSRVVTYKQSWQIEQKKSLPEEALARDILRLPEPANLAIKATPRLPKRSGR